MKNAVKTRLMAMFLCIIMVFFVSCTTPNPPSGDPVTPLNGAKKILSQTIKVYTTAQDVEEMAFAHYEDAPDILLMDSKTACEFIFGFFYGNQKSRQSFSREPKPTTGGVALFI